MLTRLFLFLCLIIQAGCAPYLVVSRGTVNRYKLQEIKTGLAALRGLAFKTEVAVEVKNKDEMGRHLEADLAREYGDEKLQNIAVAYTKLGLFPEGVDLKRSLLDFYNAQVVAFYDPKAKKLVLPEDLGGGMFLATLQFVVRRDILGEMVLAHELTHALQDQHFLLEDRLGPSSNEDKTLAFRSVVEGDATLSGFGYLFGGIDKKSLAEVHRAIQGSIGEARAALAGVPEAIVEELLFQYYGGVSFVSRLLDERGWLGVNLLYSSPPLSTEQVLHPEKYLDQPDRPTHVDLKDLSPLFPSGWREIENNVLGELMVQVLFKQFHSEEEGKVVAHGWDGDRFVAFRRGEEVSFIWATVWDSSKDAEEFSEKYQEILSKKYGGPATAGSYAHIEQRDRLVIIVEGLEKAHVMGNIEKIWQGMELKEESY
ncbi:MAG: hypothetical protein HY694_16220 [Deltaproteobacteria bacterium]|nr:hypothetical protein [Deltaproteobacteria bacterium]